MRADLLPTCWIPEKKQRDERELLRFRANLVRIRTRVKNAVWAILDKHNTQVPLKALWGPRGRKFLEELKLGKPHEGILKQCLELIALLDQQVTHWDKKLAQMVKLTPEGKRLISAPGIQKIIAMTILSESGPIERFPGAKRYVSYCGLSPKTHASGGKVWHGRLSRQANLILKWAMVEVAMRAGTGEPWRGYYSRLKRNKGMPVSRVALDRQLTARKI